MKEKENKSKLSRRKFLKNVEVVVGGSVLGPVALINPGATGKAHW